MIVHGFTHLERRSAWAKGPPARADVGLRMIARREGDAVFCRACDGDGMVLSRLGSTEPRKCSRCGGEGLEPPE